MLLRIEDTDRARSKQDTVDAILDSLRWLGIDWDGDPISQASRADRHKQVANQMVMNGAAYRCYCTKAQVDASRAKVKAGGLPFRHRCDCRNCDPGGTLADTDFVIRLKVPDDGTTVVNDLVKGALLTPNNDLDDFIIVRSDGSPTYMLAVVVDDHDMGITHIIRGDDHITNAAKQSLIYSALGWSVPAMAHIPLIHGSDGAKMSKRHGATGADAYKAMGYLPEAMMNYLARLGWSHGNDEIMTLDSMIKWFDFDGIGISPSRFDFRKLDSLNGHYIRDMDDNKLMSQWKAFLRANGDDDTLAWLSSPDNAGTISNALVNLKPRAKTLADLTSGASYLWRQRPLDLDAKAAKILNDDGARTILRGLYDACLQDCDWNVDCLQDTIQDFATNRGLKLGKVAQPLRAALTGRSVSQGIYDVLVDLGRDESLARIKDHVVDSMSVRLPH